MRMKRAGREEEAEKGARWGRVAACVRTHDLTDCGDS